MSPVLSPSKILESIYNLIPKQKEVIIKPKRYSSQYSRQVRENARRCKSAHRTMGYAKTPVDPPENFLKKHARLELQNPCTADFRRSDCSLPGRPSVPRRWERPVTAAKTERDFVAENARHRLLTRASSARVIRRVDNPRGDTFDPQGAGLVPTFVNKEDYGVVPNYLQRYVQEMKRRREQEEREQEQNKGAALTRVTSEERDLMLQGLKRNLGQLQCQYLNLSVVTDTLSKRQRKLALEAQIEQLEKDVNLLERHQNIFVRNY